MQFLLFGIETRTAESVAVVENCVVEEEESSPASGRIVVFDSDSDKVKLIASAVNQIAVVVAGSDEARSGAESAEQSLGLVVRKAAVHLTAIHFHTVVIAESEVVAVDFSIGFHASVE